MCSADYGCALQRDILIQGRLYISENHVCFHANIFGWVTDVRFVPCLCYDVILIITLFLIVIVTRSRTVVGYSYARDHNFGKEDDGIRDPQRHFDHNKDRKIHIRLLLVKRQHLRGHPQQLADVWCRRFC